MPARWGGKGRGRRAECWGWPSLSAVPLWCDAAQLVVPPTATALPPATSFLPSSPPPSHLRQVLRLKCESDVQRCQPRQQPAQRGEEVGLHVQPARRIPQGEGAAAEQNLVLPGLNREEGGGGGVQQRESRPGTAHYRFVLLKYTSMA